MEKESTFFQERGYFPFEIKLGVYTNKGELKEKLLDGKPINFLVTKDLSIWLTSGTHNSLTDNGVTWEDTSCLGYIKMTDNKFECTFYSKPDHSRDIEDSISRFFGLV
jgi:hypothetical protein